ncbi:MAG: thiamine pyrophosphate-binding protein [Acidobacteria bacterium]|nr:thiamine pyrophosphate-binding protein [Acidobacteriota bacterium]
MGRRNFMKVAAGGAAALVATAQAANAQQSGSAGSGAAAEGVAEGVEVLTGERPGADFMLDVLKSLDIEYITSNPGSSFRGLQESIINYGGNRNPEFLTCCHEESSVAMAHGYFKIEGKPMGVLAHGTVGLQHASMAVYNAFADRVPVYLILGNTFDATQRRPGAEWAHSVQDAAAMVRDYTKWDDMPVSLPHFAESAVRAYKIAMTPPMMPVVLVADSDLQEKPIAKGTKLRIPKLTLTSPPQGDSGAVAEVARLLVEAENPVLIADRVARTEAGKKYFTELAEFLQAPVIDRAGRMNFPTRHPLNQSDGSGALLASADVILGLELGDYWGNINSMRDQMHRSSRSRTKPGVKLISITAQDLFSRSNYQDFQRFSEIDLALAADAEATLPSLIEAVKRLANSDRKRAFQDRGAQLAKAYERSQERMRTNATYAWNASPVSTARIAAEVWAQIKNKDWALVSDSRSMSGWVRRLWSFEKYYQCIGGSGAAGVGYNSPAAVGAALANRKHGRLSVNFQKDGDLMYAPGVLWTAAHHRIPLLNIMFNNRAYHQEVMHLQRMANRYNRGISSESVNIGTTIDNPNIDYAKLAQSMGWYAEGPISDPKDLGPAIRRAIAVVERGEPALLDVVTQPR